MADLATLRTLVVLVSFFSLLFGLYAIASVASPAFFAEGITGSGPQGTIVGPTSLLAANVSSAAEITYAADYDDYDVTGWTWTRWSVCTGTDTNMYVMVESFDDYVVIGKMNWEDFTWSVSNNGTRIDERQEVDRVGGLGTSDHWVISVDTLNDIYLGTPVYPPVGPPSHPDKNMANLNFTLANGKGSMMMRIDFNDTENGDVHAALLHSGIVFSLTQDFGDRRTSMNIISFIGGLFALDAPGLPYPVNAVVGLVWWGCVAAVGYIIFSVVRSLIPFLPGG